jgi:tellurite resistance protein TerC
MTVPIWVWLATIGTLLSFVSVDVWLGRRPREIGIKEAGAWVSGYVTLAVLFGVGITLALGGTRGGEFFAGYLTEYSLSVDNLFVFVIILSRFGVPRPLQHRVLLIGIIFALALRGAFIAVGAAAVSRFDWVFFIFGGFLVYTAYGLLRSGSDRGTNYKETRLLRYVRRVAPLTSDYHGSRFIVRDGRSVHFTPLLLVIVAIAMADVLFALDSIPAIFGLTQDPYLVFTANAFALLGLRQLYFLIGGLLDRLVYLNYGLSVILGFIGVKLVIEGLHGSHLDHIGPVAIPEISILVSLGFIVATLTVVTVASLLRTRAARRAGEPGPPGETRSPVPKARD